MAENYKLGFFTQKRINKQKMMVHTLILRCPTKQPKSGTRVLNFASKQRWHSFVIINGLAKVWTVRGICHKGVKLLNKLKPSMFLWMPQFFPDDLRPTQTH